MARKKKNKNELKRCKYKLLDAKTHSDLYRLLKDTLKANHDERLGNPKIALAEAFGWKMNADGFKWLGQCKKAGELDRDLHGFDFVVLLHTEVIANKTEIGQKMLAALIDHELCHADVSRNPNTNEPRKDEKGRILYRIRRHDIEEFIEVTKRHGTYGVERGDPFRLL